MEGALQSVKASLTAWASQLRSLIKYLIDSTTAEMDKVSETMTEALRSWERSSQKINEALSKISSDAQLERENKNVEVVLLCRRENNDEEEESEVDDLNSAMGSSNRIQVDEHEFPDSKFQDMAKYEAEVVGGEENKF